MAGKVVALIRFAGRCSKYGFNAGRLLLIEMLSSSISSSHCRRWAKSALDCRHSRSHLSHIVYETMGGQDQRERPEMVACASSACANMRDKRSGAWKPSIRSLGSVPKANHRPFCC